MKSPTRRRRLAESPRRILVVDDHPLTRRGMAEFINQQPGLMVCCEAATAAEAIRKISLRVPDLVLTDFSLPDKNGLEFVKDLCALFPRVLTLVVSMHDEGIYAERVLRAGARGYIMKDQGGEKLVSAIRAVLAGNIFVSPALAAKILDVFSGQSRSSREIGLGILSDREFEVFQLLGQGLTTRQMAESLRLSPKTIETHRLNIRDKLNFKTGADLTKHAVRWAASQQLL